MQGRNRYLEALKENHNVIGITVAIAVSAAMLNPLPLLVGLVAEAAYLVFVPDSRWFELRLAKRYDADVERRREQVKQQVLPTLRPVLQARYMRLEEMRQQIGKQALDDQVWFREVLRKLDFLLEKFLQFASKEVQFRSYLDSMSEQARGNNRDDDGGGLPTQKDLAMRRSRGNSRRHTADAVGQDWQPQALQASAGQRPLAHDPDAPTLKGDSQERWIHQTVALVQGSYDQELAEIKAMAEQEQDESTKAVLAKRLDVLQRRREFVGKMGKILSNLNHQLELLEDTFGLISDEIRARSPEQVLADIDDVVSQTNTMTQLLEEVAPFEQSISHISVLS